MNKSHWNPAWLSAVLAVCAVAVNAQPNLEVWAQQVNLSLVGLTNGVLQTNGIILRAKPGSFRFSSGDLIASLKGKPFSSVTKGITNFTVVITNHVPGPDIVVTNVVTQAIPVLVPAGNPAFSSEASLVRLQSLVSSNRWGPLMVIRDGNPAVNYDLTPYLHSSSVTLSGRTNASVTQGRFDLEHDLVAATESTVQRLVFDSEGFVASPSSGLYFEVQGPAREQQFSLMDRGRVVGQQLTRNLSANLQGVGQWTGSNTCSLLRGRVVVSGGKQETW